MDLSSIMEKAKGVMGGISSIFDDGAGDDPKKKKPSAKPFDWGGEMKAGAKKVLPYDNQPVPKVVAQAAKEGKIDPSELYSSAWVEGLNEAAINPGQVSEAYNNAQKGVLSGKSKQGQLNSVQSKLDTKTYPVDGFFNYGLDTFGNNYSQLKKYLPEGFENKFQLYDALNESGDKVKTAAFRTNKDALVAKAAFMNMEKDNLTNYAKQHGVTLDDKAKKYFTMAAFNGGPGAAHAMIQEYKNAPDKNKFIDEGQSQYLGGKVHRNIAPRMKMLPIANQLLSENDQQQTPLLSPKQIVSQ